MVPIILLAAIAFAGLTLAPGANAQEEEEGVDAARTREVLACEETAQRSIERDRVITRSIAGAQEPDPISGGGGGVVGAAGAFPGEMSRFEEDRRRRRLIDECLARAGLGGEPVE